MASDKDYPRHAAQTLRKGRCAQAELDVARAKTAWTSGQAALAAAERALAEHLAAGAATSSAASVTSALALQREAAFAERHAQTTRSLRAQLSQARTHEAELRRVWMLAQEILAQAHASEQVLARDRERFDEQRRRARERAEELELEEQRKGVQRHR